MKKTLKQLIKYAILLLIGIVLGKWFFSSTEQTQSTEHHEHSHLSEEVWTCSMHPEIREDQPGDCPLCGMELTLLDEDDSTLDPKAIKMSETAMQLAKVATAFPQSFSGEDKGFSLDGNLAFNEQNKKRITADFHGRIDAFYIDYEGQEVKKGQVIAELYSPEIESLQRELLIANAKKTENLRLFEASVRKLRNWNISQADIDQILASQTIQQRIKIRSPFQGIVTNLSVRNGNHIERGDLLFEVNDHSQLWAEFQVYEKDVANVRLGDAIRFTTRSFPNKEWDAKVIFVSPVLDERKRTFTVRADVENKNLALKPSFLVRGEVRQTAKENTGLWIPKSAVLWTGKRSVVYEQVSSEGQFGFLMREIETGITKGDYIEVVSGIDKTTEIAVSGVFSIDASAQISAKPSMMNKREKKSSTVDIEWEKVTIEAEAFELIVKNYLQLKEALAEDKEEASLQHAEAFRQLVTDLNMADATAKSGLLQLTKDVAKSKNIDMARMHFQFLSDAIVALAKQQNPLEETLYLQFCPMADNDNGAFWLSTEPTIKNPYFGSMMLRCGSVEGEL
jgi:Cu(I)/Ag(I) efflux system membrane fusion protein